ncbi:uroporphyrinogen decarboxylase family protein [Candidatus Izemoplasma sp. B36]|uniref:uroporphyrinogen decarboxylase family protein n=1 Tax=Candidatus Izemoplasma sp. B36 TaxID=3242468 RepID=UPI003556EF82
MLRNKDREPNFDNFKRMLEKKPVDRPVLFDFIIGDEKMKTLIGDEFCDETYFDRIVSIIKSFDAAGYDFSPILLNGLIFPRNDGEEFLKQTRSLNSGATIVDRESFNKYVWPENNANDFSVIQKAAEFMHSNAKLVPFAYDGILENVVGIVGYENLCYLQYDDPELMAEIFKNVGSRIYEYYQRVLEYDEVGAIICNDDWGFNTQTMLSPEMLRKHVFPWYKKIVKAAHDKNKPAILHSCGYFEDIIEDIIEDMKFDGRHSYEDKIMPVEKAFEKYKGRIAILGGIDIDFIMRESKEAVIKRAKNLLSLSKEIGGYALGTGNSIPDYLPDENIFALLKVGLDGFSKE